MKRRLVLAIVGVAAAAVALFALPLAAVLERSYRDEELLRLQRDTVAASRSIDLTRGTRDQIELPRSTDGLGIYSTTGIRIVGYGPRTADAPTRSALRARRPTGSTPAGQLVVAVPLLSGELVTGAVRAQRSQAGVVDRAHRAWLALAALAGGVVALAALAALALGRQLTRPLETLAAVARRVGDGDFGAHAVRSKISEIDAVGGALNSSSQRIDELVNRERTFSADASHQLRTPLTALRLELEAVALGARESQPQLAAALAQVDRLESTIETLLSVARGGPAGEAKTDLAQALTALEKHWRGTLAASGRPLRTSLQVRPAIAKISSAVLSEVTDVLLENAYVHGAGAVHVVVRSAGDALAIEVSDQGPGFGSSPDEAFTRGTGAGHGIGLALARSLVHAQGARLQITHAGPEPTISVLIAPA